MFRLIGLNFTRNVLNWLLLPVGYQRNVESFLLLSFGEVSAETRQLMCLSIYSAIDKVLIHVDVILFWFGIISTLNWENLIKNQIGANAVRHTVM